MVANSPSAVGHAESKLGELVAVRDTIELSGGVVSRPVGCVGRCLVAVGPMTKSSVLSVSLRRSAGLAVVVRDWADVSVDELQAAAPWRTFRWRHGQKHFSGAYWSSTQRDVVIYESRLELARLLFADFEPSVVGIVAQPFLLQTEVKAKQRRHIPDYLFVTNQGPVVVDVKPQRRLADSTTVSTFEWTRAAVQSRGWGYEVASEPPKMELENVRFLAGYRRDWLFDNELLDDLRAIDLVGATLGDAFGCLPRRRPALVRSAVLHLLWRQEFKIDLTKPLNAHAELKRRG